MEGANTNTAVLQTMGEAAKALKKAHADMDVDQVMQIFTITSICFKVIIFWNIVSWSFSVIVISEDF